MSEGITSLGAGGLDASFFGRSGDIYNQQGLRDYLQSPEQGQQFNTISREASRNLFNSVIRPSSWKSVLGQQPAAESNYRLDTGEYTPEGSVRARTGLSGAELRAPSGIYDDYLFGGFGEGAFGGLEDTYDFSYQDEDAQRIARTGNLGALAQDRSGVAYGQAPFDISQPYQFGETGETDFGGFGGGQYSTTGQVTADLQAPQSQLSLDNQIRQRLAGSGQTQFSETLGGETAQRYGEETRQGSTGQLEGSLARMGVGLGAKALGAGASQALTAAGLAGLTNPITAGISLAALPLGYLASQAVGRLASDYEINRRWDTNARAEAGLEADTRLGLEGPGSVDFNQQAQAQAGTQNLGYKGQVTSDVSSILNQQAQARGGPGSQIDLRMAGDVGGVTDTALTEYEKTKKSALKWDPKTMYNAAADSATSQQANLLGNIQAQNTEQMLRQNVPQEWITNNIDPQIAKSFQTYKDRYPGLYGNYQNADDFITREYYRQNPQVQAQIEQQAQVQNIANATAPGLDYRDEARQNVESSGSIGLSGPGGIDYSSGAEIDTQQVSGVNRTPFSGAYGSRAIPSSTIDLQLQSDLSASLQGLGAQANAVNDLKFQFNDEEYGATLQLKAQRFINDLEAQIPHTRDSQLFIESLRNNPELTALFEQGLAPETITQATLEYDNVNKTFQNKLAWEQQQNYQAAQVYDPTPDQPNSGDEVGLVNIFGDVRQLDPGKLYDVGYTDVLDYSTDYKLPTPLTTQSNEFLQDQYNWNQELANQMYYYTPGQSELYNTLAQEFINRRYDLTDQFDQTTADQYLQQIQGLQEGQGLDNYSYEELQNIQNLLQQERALDIDPTGRSLTGEMSQEFFLPETEAINPVFNYYISGKGYYGDPRAMDPSTASLLEKYYNFDRWGYGEHVQDELAYAQGRAPGSYGAGSRREEMLSPRELTPEEFATTQIKAQPEDYQWQAQQYDPLMQDLAYISSYYKSYFPVYSTKQVQQGWSPSEEVNSQAFTEAPLDPRFARMTRASLGSTFVVNYEPGSGLNFWQRAPISYGSSYYTDPNVLNYETYQSDLSDEIQRYLAQNTQNRPV